MKERPDNSLMTSKTSSRKNIRCQPLIFLEATGKMPKLDSSQKAQAPNASDLINFMITEFLN
jgi:hypothetical protein